jgi:hypothetical protein
LAAQAQAGSVNQKYYLREITLDTKRKREANLLMSMQLAM